jgi:hypothetical protein
MIGSVEIREDVIVREPRERKMGLSNYDRAHGIPRCIFRGF